MNKNQYLQQRQQDKSGIPEKTSLTAFEKIMKFTNQVVKNLDESGNQRQNSKGKSPPRPFALQPSPKPKARPVATMATGIFIEAID